MQIDSIRYRRSKNVGYREYEDIEVSAAVTTEDDPQETLLYLKRWVNEKLQLREEVERLGDKKNQLQSEVNDLEESVKHAKDKWQNVQEFLSNWALKPLVTYLFKSNYAIDYCSALPSNTGTSQARLQGWATDGDGPCLLCDRYPSTNWSKITD